jgi:hypothetical protein
MYSYQSFTPGNKRNTSKIINYVAMYNLYFPNSKQLTCICIPDKYDKNTPGSDSSSTRVSYNLKISQIINYSKGGKTQYGNFYLNKPLNVNYLGKYEGMPGGSGMPPLNKF